MRILLALAATAAIGMPEVTKMILTPAQVDQTLAWARQYSFIPA